MNATYQEHQSDERLVNRVREGLKVLGRQMKRIPFILNP